jgi:ribosomal protein S18 acetylase RimI-like enzyme
MQPIASERVHVLALTEEAPPEFVEGARQLLLEYGEFVKTEGNAANFCYGDLKIEAAGLPQSYLGKGGELLVAVVEVLVEGKAAVEMIGCLGWRRIPPPEWATAPEQAAELKRLWVEPEARGLDAGRMLIQAALDAALAAGASAMYLDTIEDSMPQAVALYRSMGFAPCAAYSGEALSGVSYFRLSL